eukprot:COSAG02_NODE_6450_length_3562_cov_4.810858_3_plen_87_part_00
MDWTGLDWTSGLDWTGLDWTTVSYYKSIYSTVLFFERYYSIYLAETAHPRPLGPKGEGNLVSAGKLQYGICRVAVSFESYSRYESL